MNENENKVCPVSCKIEHHAMMFAFLAKHAIELCGEAGKEAILAVWRQMHSLTGMSLPQ